MTKEPTIRDDKTFISWLKKRKKEDNPIGDLAKDVIDDTEIREQKIKSYAQLEMHMHLLSVSRNVDDATKALRKAFRQFVAEKKALEEDK